MTWRHGFVFVLAALMVLAVGVAVQASPGQWFHVRVQDGGEDSESVKVNVPLALVQTVVPKLKNSAVKNGTVKINHGEFTVEELREIWTSLKSEGDFDMATIQKEDLDLRISLEAEKLVVRTTEASEKQILISIPSSVVDALLSGQGEELNIEAAIDALVANGTGDLVSIQDGDKNVRVWIDSSSSSE